MQLHIFILTVFLFGSLGWSTDSNKKNTHVEGDATQPADTVSDTDMKTRVLDLVKAASNPEELKRALEEQNISPDQVIEALEGLRKSLEETEDPQEKAQLEASIRSLEALPVEQSLESPASESSATTKSQSSNAKGLGSVSGYFSSVAQNKENSALVRILAGIAVGPASLLDTLPGAIKESAAGARGEIDKALSEKKDPVTQIS